MKDHKRAEGPALRETLNSFQMPATHLGDDTEVVIDKWMFDPLAEGTRENFFCRVEIAGLQRLDARRHLDFK